MARKYSASLVFPCAEDRIVLGGGIITVAKWRPMYDYYENRNKIIYIIGLVVAHQIHPSVLYFI